MDALDTIFGDDGGDRLLMLFVLSFVVFAELPEGRNPLHFEQRLSWHEYAATHTARGTFDIQLRMPLDSFNKLLGNIREYLVVNETKGNIKGGCPA